MRSDNVTKGSERAPNRSLFYALGYTKEELERPLIGVVSAYSEMFVDNCAMQIVKNPAQCDVIVTENMFGDILSDEASMITGSIGMIPSSSLGDGTRGPVSYTHLLENWAPAS